MHLKVLEQARLISRSRQGRLRPCRLRPETLRAVAGWADATRAGWSGASTDSRGSWSTGAATTPPPGGGVRRKGHTTMNDRDYRETTEREIVLTRVLDAPREQVYAAWTEPERIGVWYGPEGWSCDTRGREWWEGER